MEKKDDKKNKLYQGKGKNKNMEDDDEFNENRYTNCFKKYFSADTYPTCLEFSPSDNTLMVRYQDEQAEWWKNSYYELDKEKNIEILDLQKRIVDLEYEIEDIKETAFRMQHQLKKGGYDVL